MKPAFVLILSTIFLSSQLHATSLPLVNQPLVPASIKPGSHSFTLTVNGTGFTATSLVNWNGSPRPTSAISTNTLQATMGAADVAKAGTASVTVTNGAGLVSNFVFFPVRNPSSMIAMAAKQVFPNCSVATAGDFNNDGKLDVAWVDSTNGNLNVSFGDGKGGFAAPISTAVTFWGPVDFELFVGDFNNDGKLDVAGTTGNGKAYYFLGNGDGTFTEQFLGGGGRLPYIAAADFAGSGTLSLYQEQDDLGNQWFTVLGNLFPISGFAIFPGLPAIGDFNRDGKLDLAVPISSGGAQIYLGNGSTFVPTGPLVEGATPMATADFNGDGKLDLIGGCVSFGNGDGTFSLGPCGSYSEAGVGIGDFNGDGILDVANRFAISLGKGDGSFPNVFLLPASTASNTYGAVGDFNNDGKLDIITGNGFLLLQTTASLSAASLAFGNQNVGTISPPQTVTLTNIGVSALPLQAFTITGTNPTDFTKTTTCGSTLAAGASCNVNVKFGPKAAGGLTAFVNVKYTGVGSPQTIALSGTGIAPPSVSLLPSTLTFATQLVGTTSSAQTATLRNTGTQTVNISSIAVPAPFQQTNNCPAALLASASCQIQVAFAPTVGGILTGKLSVTDNAAHSPQKVALTGTGTVVTISPIGVNFGTQKVGTSSRPTSLTLKNVGKTPLSLTQVAFTGSNPADFSQTNNCGASVSARASCTIKAVFKPTAAGSRSANLAITDNGGASPQTVPVAGTGQ